MTNEELHKLWIDKGQGMKALKSVYQQGRADAIDEFVKLLKNDILHSIFDSRNSLAEHIEDIAGRLKEKK